MPVRSVPPALPVVPAVFTEEGWKIQFSVGLIAVVKLFTATEKVCEAEELIVASYSDVDLKIPANVAASEEAAL